jgi:hypothetical protein
LVKIRTYITPSSIGSYFGVGFNSPEEQIELDLGNVEEEFDEDAQDRMLLGRIFEDASLNYFEEKLHIKITDRNNLMMNFYDDKIKGVVDGMTILDGEPTVVENKISNAQSGKFTDKMGYILQCQCYMMAKNVDQALLCGMYQGKPIFKIIKRDEEVITDIKRMADFVVDVLMGLDDFTNFPRDILAKYSNTVILPRLENVSDEIIAKAKELAGYKAQMKELKEKSEEIEDLIKENFQTGVYDGNGIKITIGEVTKEGGFDLDAFSINNPTVEFSKYKKPDYSYRTLRVLAKKSK